MFGLMAERLTFFSRNRIEALREHGRDADAECLFLPRGGRDSRPAAVRLLSVAAKHYGCSPGVFILYYVKHKLFLSIAYRNLCYRTEIQGRKHASRRDEKGFVR